MAFSKICDDRGKLGKGQKETGAKGRKREETRREGMGLFGFLSLPRAAKKKGVAVGPRDLLQGRRKIWGKTTRG